MAAKSVMTKAEQTRLRDRDRMRRRRAEMAEEVAMLRQRQKIRLDQENGRAAAAMREEMEGLRNAMESSPESR